MQRRLVHALVLLAVFWCGVIPAGAGTTVWTGAHSFSLGVTSMAERRWERVIRQQYDFSCGSAAVATLLNYHYGIPRTEAQVFEAMYQQGDQAQIRTEGFSMLDLKQYLDAHELRSDGFRMSLAQLAEIGVPAIALVSTNGYRHFVVVKGIRGEEVLVGDPAGGAAIIPITLMEEIWNGILLAARAQQDVARQNFNHPQDWALRPDAPLGTVRSNASIPVRGLNLPGINEFGR
ncbi:MAG: C39 family peptidase [Thioalkalivibrio sp.]